MEGILLLLPLGCLLLFDWDRREVCVWFGVGVFVAVCTRGQPEGTILDRTFDNRISDPFILSSLFSFSNLSTLSSDQVMISHMSHGRKSWDRGVTGWATKHCICILTCCAVGGGGCPPIRREPPILIIFIPSIHCDFFLVIRDLR